MRKIWLNIMVMVVVLLTSVLPVLGYINSEQGISPDISIKTSEPVPDIKVVPIPIQISPLPEIIIPIPPIQMTGLSVTTDKSDYHVGDQIRANVRNFNDYKVNIDSVSMINVSTGDVVDTYQCMIPEGCNPNTLVSYQGMTINWKAQSQGQYQIKVQWWRQYDCYPKCLIATKLETSYSKIFTIS